MNPNNQEQELQRQKFQCQFCGGEGCPFCREKTPPIVTDKEAEMNKERPDKYTIARIERLKKENEELKYNQAELERLKHNLNTFLHPNGDGPKNPSWCDLVGYVKADRKSLESTKLKAVRSAMEKERQEEPNAFIPELYKTTDARAWAKECLKVLKWKPSLIDDEEWLAGWFANAMMAKADAMSKKGQEADKPAESTVKESLTVQPRLKVTSADGKTQINEGTLKQHVQKFYDEHF